MNSRTKMLFKSRNKVLILNNWTKRTALGTLNTYLSNWVEITQKSTKIEEHKSCLEYHQNFSNSQRNFYSKNGSFFLVNRKLR